MQMSMLSSLSSPDWTSLPRDLLLRVYHHLPDLRDHLRFRRVCPSWRGAVKSSPLPPQLPFLLLPSLSLLPPPYTCPLPHPLPIPNHNDARLYSTSHSLLLLLDLSPFPSLLNPITSTLTPLPPLTTLSLLVSFDPSHHGHEYSILPDFSSSTPLRRSRGFIRDSFLKKAVFSDGLLAVLVHYAPSRLFVCSPGVDAEWTPVYPRGLAGPILDFTWWMGRLYAVDSDGRVAPCGEVSTSGSVPAIGPGGYLVSSGKELFQARKYDVRDDDGNWSGGFEVWRLEVDGEWRWEKTHGVGEGKALFWCGWNWMVAECGRESCCVWYPCGGEEYRRRGGVGYDVAAYDLKEGNVEKVTFDWSGEFDERLASWFVPMIE